jgi:hypothetical protein
VTSLVVGSASPDPTFTCGDTLSDIGNNRNVPFLTGPVPAGMLGGDVSVPAAARAIAGWFAA